jgi:hypothetical protein
VDFAKDDSAGAGRGHVRHWDALQFVVTCAVQNVSHSLRRGVCANGVSHSLAAVLCG